ncbi:MULTISPECIES: thioredoxin family protein [Acidovorax]|uniref:Thioredoxin family protein n=1 Tax=Acidovorax facilis TaxID=12917 RepID=A0ABV8D4B6_9BURK|nr:MULTISPECIES: thioredoxin family protein [Acidovorax]KQB58529.1 thioredoxin [Acidovorax sp. SD340]MBO1009681.1 thioredoxin family protein [Acidovorax sp. SD340]MCO4243533.1 thioredoxin family protein [Acidovorax facilis]
MSSPAALPPSSPPSPAAAAPGGWWAVCLCAAWCGTCGIYRPLFNELARAHPEVRFEWVDIEDESDLAGDLDVETFPTLLIADGQRALFLGPLLPQAPVLARLLASLQAAPGSAGAGGEAQGVFERVRAARSQ